MYSLVDRYVVNGQIEWHVRRTNILTIQQAIGMMSKTNKDQYVIKTDDLKTLTGKIYWPYDYTDDVIVVKL